jgi:hypothetical protein
MAKDPKVEGASKSLNKTITEIMAHLGQPGPRPPTGLRDFLYEKIGDLSERWFRKGFNRGHTESRKEFKTNGKVPRTLTFDCSRSLSPRQIRKIKKKKKSKSAM